MIVPKPEDFHHIDFLGLRITEPVTAGTDILIFLLSIFLSILLYRSSKKPDHPQKNHWTCFFFFMGVSTLAGAITHGARYYLTDTSFISFFGAMNVFSGFSSLSAQLATFSYRMNRKPSWLLFLFIIVNVIFITAVLISQTFVITNIYVTLTFLFVLFIHLKTYKQDKGSFYISAGILVSFITAFVFLSRISISDIWFNHKDIAHIFIMLSLVIMYKGAKRIQANAIT